MDIKMTKCGGVPIPEETRDRWVKMVVEGVMADAASDESVDYVRSGESMVIAIKTGGMVEVWDCIVKRKAKI